MLIEISNYMQYSLMYDFVFCTIAHWSLLFYKHHYHAMYLQKFEIYAFVKLDQLQDLKCKILMLKHNKNTLANSEIQLLQKMNILMAKSLDCLNTIYIHRNYH